jgi:fumarate reductase flavoprotein subunit
MSDPDVIVVGGGLAGLSAGLRAAEHGLRVVVFEAGSEEAYLCNSRIAGGLFHIALDDMGGAPQDITARIEKTTTGCADGPQTAVMARRATTTIRWLRSHGVKLIKGGPDGLRRHALAPPGIRRSGFSNQMWRGRSGDVMLRALEAAFTRLGGKVVRGVRAETLLMEAGRCVGVSANRAGDRLLERFISPRPTHLLKRNAGTGVGGGLRMAEVVGASIVGGKGFYGHLQYRGALQDTSYWPYPMLDTLATDGILVDGHGQRRFDEGLGGVALTNAVAASEDPSGFWAVFDDRTWQGPATEWLLPANPTLVRAGGKLVMGGTIAELAAATGLGQTLVETVAGYNAAIASGGPILPPRTSENRHPIVKAPFYAVPLCAGVTYTMCGIAIDDGARVLDRDGQPIKGLWAAGATTAGLEGGPAGGYIGGLSKASVFGMLAGETIARTLHDTGPV